MKKKAYFLIVTLLIFGSCAFAIAFGISEHAASSSNYTKGYQLFWGTWEVTEVISGGRLSTPEKIKNLVGRTVEYSSDFIKVDGVPIAQQPKYTFETIPMEMRHLFYGTEGPENAAQVFEKDAAYFTYIHVIDLWSDQWKENYLWVGDFYLKDDATLILNVEYAHGTGLLKMERVAHIENYPDCISGI